MLNGINADSAQYKKQQVLYLDEFSTAHISPPFRPKCNIRTAGKAERL